MERKTNVVTWFAIALIAIALICFARHRGSIQADLTARANDAVLAAGIPDVEVSSRGGRDVRLEGVVADENMRRRAEAAVSDVAGVRRVENRLRASAPRVLDDLSVALGEGSVTVAGTVADVMTRDGLLALAQQRFSSMTVVDRIEIDPESEPTRAGLGALLIESFDPAIAPGAIELVDGELVVTGRVASEAWGREYADQLVRLFAGTNIVNRLEVAAQPALDEILGLRRVDFESSSDRLTTDGRRTLDEVAAVLAKWPDLEVEISGHTDSTGNPEDNLDLSRRRAESARAYLERTVASERFTVVGYGAARPIANNDTSQGRIQNRRIEFRVKEETDQ